MMALDIGERLTLGHPIILPLLAEWARGIVNARMPNETIMRADPWIDRWYLARKNVVPVAGGREVEDAVAAGAVAPILVPSEIENLYLHRYLRPDLEPMHDHPWPNGTLVLSGWLREDTAEGTRILRPGEIALRGAHEAHAIVDVEPGTLTLFATLRKEREWGFLGEHGWLGWRDHRPTRRAVAA